MPFKNRKDAGARLAERLEHYSSRKDVLVLTLPRGGTVTGFEIARLLSVPLDVLIVRKLGFPSQPELAMGAVAETGDVAVNQDLVAAYGGSAYLEAETVRQKDEISRRIARYRRGAHLPDLAGRIVILVDDGVATGATMKAAISALRKEPIASLVVALPVAPPSMAGEIEQMADEFICLQTPPGFRAVGNYYEDFTQVSDEEVVELMQKSRALLACGE
jgi:putative phosphoribosyl transferase